MTVPNDHIAVPTASGSPRDAADLGALGAATVTGAARAAHPVHAAVSDRTARPGRRLSAAAALGAAGLLVLTACGGAGEEEPASGSADAGASQSESAGSGDGEGSGAGDAEASGSEGGDSGEGGGDSAEAADFAPGDCLKTQQGMRDVANFEKVDCEGEHRAEYLWSVPEQSPEETGISEHMCRIVGIGAAQEETDVFASATELLDTRNDTMHCIVYSLEDRGWEGQIVDTGMTLEKAKDTIDIDEEVGRTS